MNAPRLRGLHSMPVLWAMTLVLFGWTVVTSSPADGMGWKHSAESTCEIAELGPGSIGSYLESSRPSTEVPANLGCSDGLRRFLAEFSPDRIPPIDSPCPQPITSTLVRTLATHSEL